MTNFNVIDAKMNFMGYLGGQNYHFWREAVKQK